MLRDYSLWINILFFIFSNKFLLINGNDRENLAARHPCNSINKRLEPFIKWTEKLASSQYGGQFSNVIHIHLKIDLKVAVNALAGNAIFMKNMSYILLILMITEYEKKANFMINKY